MSVPVLTSPYRIGVSPAFVGANSTTTSTKIYGRLPSAPATASSISDIWPGAAIQGVRNLPTSVFQIAVASDSAQDILTSGSGAWTVQIIYLDANYASQTLSVNLNGQTAVATGINALRIQSAQVIATGSGGVNAGNIYVYDATSSLSGGVPQTATKLYAQIAIGYNTDGLGMYTVPAGYQAQILHVISDVTTGTATAYNARVRVGAAYYSGTLGGGSLLPFQYAVIAGPSTTAPPCDLRSYLPDTLPAGSEIRFQASSTASGAEVIVIAEILLIPSSPSTSAGVE
jgi:hypothetical protein